MSDITMDIRMKLIHGNLLGGIAFLLFGCMELWGDSSDYGMVDAVITVVLFIGILRSVWLLRKSSEFKNSCKKSWLYYVLLWIRFIGCFLIVLGMVPETGINTGPVFMVLGISCLLEAAYWKWLMKNADAQ